MSRRFLPLLSYAQHEVDPGLDASRNEGEARLRRIRALLRITTKTPGMESFLDPSNKASLPAMLGPRLKDPPCQWELAERQGVLDSLLSSNHKEAPTATRVAPTVRTCTVEEADGFDEVTRQQCVLLKREKLLALPSSPPMREPQPRIVIRWPKAMFKIIKGATQRSTLTIENMGPGRVRFTIENAMGDKFENLFACDIPDVILNSAFAMDSAAPSASPSTPPEMRVPYSEGELPEHLQLQLAAFAQVRMRAHVLVAAAGPAAANRPLGFENMKLSWKQPGGKAKRPGMQVKAYLHPTSATRLCSAHLLQPVEKRCPNIEFTGKEYVTMTMEMCGDTLDPARDMGCPTHGAKCQRNPFAPGICCSNISISFSSNHEQKGEWKPAGLWIPGGDLGQYGREELGMLLGTCVEYYNHAKPLFAAGHDGKEKLCRLVTECSRVLEERVERFDTHALGDKTRGTDADLLKLDLLALESLRMGGMVQAKLNGHQKVPKLHRPHGAELNAEEKKLAKTHHWMFPRQGQPFGVRTLETVQLPATGAAPGSPSSGDTEQTQNPQPEHPDAKRQRTGENKNYDYEGMTEYIDPEGMKELSRQINDLLADPELPAQQRARGQYFLQYIAVCDNEYGTETDGPLGWTARPLYCKYRSRNDGGRLYPTGMPKAPGWHKGEARSVCIQAAPREVRPFMCCRWAHDYDMKNAQPQMLRQMAKMLTWPDGREPPDMPQLRRWCRDRDEFITHVADMHDLPEDEDRHYEYRKDIIKELMIRLMFGGKYKSWIQDICEEFGRKPDAEPRVSRIEELSVELLTLRKATFESHQWMAFVEKDRARLRREGKKKDEDAIDRAVFARIAQKTENEVLTVMRAFLTENGFTSLSLCFDGVRALRPLFVHCLRNPS